MTQNRKKRMLYGCLTLLMMVLIFIMSAQDATHSDETSGWLLNTDFGQMLIRILPELTKQGPEHDIRKYAHLTEYAALAVFACMYFRELPKLRRSLAPVCAFGVSFCYACTDEWHQRFVPGRSGQFKDVLIDSCGALAGLFLLCLILWITERRKRRISEQGGS